MTRIKKKLPVGIDSFEKVIRNDYYYLDKTMFIKELIESAGDANLFTRPRRFGKTLTISMLKSFFEIGSDPSLFHGLAIEKEQELCNEYQGRFPVVSISLKGIEADNYKDAVESLKILISTECKRFSYLKQSNCLDPDDKEVFSLLSARKSNQIILQHSLTFLMRMLHTYYGEPVILLIDEYDVPLNKSYEKGYYDQMVTFLRSFFGEVLKGNPDLKFAVLTGCLRISKESFFTGINNLSVNSISTTGFDEYFGFTNTDVKTILEDYELCFAYKKIREWYDGYRFGNTEVYCPWDVINYCKSLLRDPNAEPQAYWDNTSSNEIVKRFIEKADATTRVAIEKLIAGEAIERPLTENLTYAEIDETAENLWSMLYLTGYLTADREKRPTQSGYMRFVIPNKEIQTIFKNKIQKWFKEKVVSSAEDMDALYTALTCGNTEQAQEIISSFLEYSISYHDERENFYHGFLIGLLSYYRSFTLRSNRETGLGRYDIILKNNKFGIIFEIKYTKDHAEMDAKCDEALRQIEDKKYAEELIKQANTVWIYGIAFADKRCCMKVKQLKPSISFSP